MFKYDVGVYDRNDVSKADLIEIWERSGGYLAMDKTYCTVH